MAKQANRKLIGGFVVLAVGIMAASVIIFGSGQYFKRTYEFVLYFDEPVKGLNVGAPVLLRGVQVGQVKNIVLRTEVKEFKFYTSVIIEVYPERFELIGPGKEILDPKTRVPVLIERGLRAQLVTLSLITGQLAIEVEMHPDKPAVSRKIAMDEKYTEIPTIPSTLARLEKGLEKLDIEELGAHLKSILAGADRLINSPDLTAGVHELKGAMQDARGLLQNANGQVRPLSESMQATLSKAQKAIDDADKLVRDVDDQVKPLSESVQATLSDAQKAIDLASQDFHALSGDAEKVLKDVDSHIVPLLDQARNTLVNMDNFIGEDSDTRYKLNQALDAIAAASQSLGSLMDYLEKHPEAVLKGKGGK